MKKFITTMMCIVALFCFNNSLNAQTSTDSVNVTLQVDMNNVTSSFVTPEVNGTFNSWCGSCWSMSDPDSDNVWQVTGKVLKM